VIFAAARGQERFVNVTVKPDPKEPGTGIRKIKPVVVGASFAPFGAYVQHKHGSARVGENIDGEVSRFHDRVQGKRRDQPLVGRGASIRKKDLPRPGIEGDGPLCVPYIATVRELASQGVQPFARVQEFSVVADRLNQRESTFDRPSEVHGRLVSVLGSDFVVQTRSIQLVERIEEEVAKSRSETFCQPVLH